MGKRKGRKETQEFQIPADEIGENGEEEGGKGAGFFACYLLTSLCPRFKGHTYIGYTLNPRRRIRQHNGEIGSGACRTKKRRPWEMVLCIYGFPTNVAALQFEWAWQHPVESVAVRNAATSFKSLSGLASKIKLAYTMLTLPAWQSLNLTVNLFSTKYQMYTSACPALPAHMRTQVCSMDDLPCYNENACANDEWDDNEFEPSFQFSTENESTGAAREIHNSPSYDASGWPRNLPLIREEDQGQPFSINNSPTKTSFSFYSSSVIENLQSPRLVESSKDFDEPFNKQRSTTASVADEDQQSIRSPVTTSREIEIIDIFTPSPCYHINLGRKRRKPTLRPEIIDLTNSPIYV